MNLEFILFGNMCSGKTTVGQILKNEFDYSVVSAKDVISNNLESSEDYVKELRKTGSLLPDEIIIKWIFKEIDNVENENKPVILDGFPRTETQAKEVIKHYGGLIKIIYTDFGLKIINQRFHNRIICRNCDMPYSKIFTDFNNECFYCGSNYFIPRPTDRPDYFDKKTSQFKSFSLKVLPVFKQEKYDFLGIDNHSTFSGLRAEVTALVTRNSHGN